MTDAHTITITGKISYQDEISAQQAARIITFLNSGDAGSVDAEEPSLGFSETRTSSTKKAQTPRDAIDLSGAKRNPEKIVALGAYVLQDGGGETFKAEDVKAQFRRARETAPGNFPRDLSTAVSAGWIAEDAPGEYYLTNKMTGIFDGAFSFSEIAKSRGPKKASKSSKAKSSKPDVFADIDEFSPTLDGFPAYSAMKIAKNRLLWVLAFAKSHGINGLANKDIEWITDHIGTGIPNGQITGAFNRAKSVGYANRSTQDQSIRITDEGRKYLAALGSDD